MEIIILLVGLVLFIGTVIRQGEPSQMTVEARDRTER